MRNKIGRVVLAIAMFGVAEVGQSTYYPMGLIAGSDLHRRLGRGCY